MCLFRKHVVWKRLVKDFKREIGFGLSGYDERSTAADTIDSRFFILKTGRLLLQTKTQCFVAASAASVVGATRTDFDAYEAEAFRQGRESRVDRIVFPTLQIQRTSCKTRREYRLR